MTEEFPLTAIMELKLYKKLLKRKLAEQEERMLESKKRKKQILKDLAKKDNPRAEDLVHAEQNVIKEVQIYNGLWTANELFNKVKEEHNKKIQKIKENGQLLQEIEVTQKELDLKKEKAKNRNLTIPKKKKEKQD